MSHTVIATVVFLLSVVIVVDSTQTPKLKSRSTTLSPVITQVRHGLDSLVCLWLRKVPQVVLS